VDVRRGDLKYKDFEDYLWRLRWQSHFGELLLSAIVFPRQLIKRRLIATIRPRHRHASPRHATIPALAGLADGK
jgi:hypothetical protein